MVCRAGESTDSAGVSDIAGRANALSARNDLVVSTGVAVALIVKQLIALALTDAERSLRDLSLRTRATISVVDGASGANSADTVD